METDFTKFILSVTWQSQQRNWMEHMAINMPKILQGKNISEIPKEPDKPCFILAGGPSIKCENLNFLRKWKHRIICCDKLLIPLLKRRVVPEIVTTVDGSSIVKKFYDHRLVRKYCDEIKFVFSVQTVHSDVVNVITQPENIYWFVAAWDNPEESMSISKIFQLQTKKTILGTGGNVGTMSWHLANYLANAPNGMLGIDFSYGPISDLSELSKTTYYETFKILSNNNEVAFLEFYKRTKTWAGIEVLTDMIFISYLRLLLPALQQSTTTINLGKYSIVTPENVKTMIFKEFVEKFGQ